MKKNQFHIIRADKAGVFMCKIISKIGTDYTVSSLQRLYYWRGALDVSMVAKEGVNPSGCKFSVRLDEEDISTIHNVLESHPVSEKALKTINSVSPWKQYQLNDS